MNINGLRLIGVGHFCENEGQRQRTEILDNLGNVVRTTSEQYTEPVEPRGISDHRRGEREMSAENSELTMRQINQQGGGFAPESFLPLGLLATDSYSTSPAQDWTQTKAFGGQRFPKDDHVSC